MTSRAAVTVNRPREDVERQWRSSDPLQGSDAKAIFKDAPGDRGTEIHLELDAGSKIGGVLQKVGLGSDPWPKLKDELRRFKQKVETGVIPSSDGAPEGQRSKRLLKPRPAQPLSATERQEVGV